MRIPQFPFLRTLHAVAWLLAVLAVSVQPLRAAPLNPIATTGHDADIVFENDGSPAQNEEIGSRWFFEQGLFGNAAGEEGLPASPARTVSGFVSGTTGNTINFAFNDYGANNVIGFEPSDAGPTALTLVTPMAYSQLAVVYSAGSLSAATANLNYTINYTGGGTQSGTIVAADWGVAAATGSDTLLNLDRANTGPVWDNSSTTLRWSVYVTEITPSSSATIESISFSCTLSGSQDVAVFGLAGATSGAQPVSITAATATPASVNRGQSTLLSVSVTNGTAPYTMTVDASSVGGPASVALVNDGSGFTFTNTVTTSGGAAGGNYSLPVSVADSAAGTANGNIALTIVGASLVWNGNLSSDWDLATANWQGGLTYQAGDNVRFDDSASGATGVNLAAALTPVSVTVSNVTKNYGFGGAGNLSGAARIIKDGTGTLYITNQSNNDFTNSLTIVAGTVRVGDGSFAGSLGTGLVTNHGALFFNRADALTVANSITGAGTLTKQGAGSLTLSGASTYDGAATVQAGTLITANNLALGSTNGATTINSGATLDVNGSNLGAELVSVSGTGDGGNGAIINSGAQQINALRYVTLLGNTTFGGSARWDIRGASELNTGGNAYKLTKIGANQISLTGVTVDSALGDVEVQQGIFSLETTTSGLGNPANSLKVASGASLQLFALGTPLNKVITLTNDGSTASLINASGASSIASPVNLVNDGVFNVGGTSLSLNGNVTGAALSRTLTGFGNLILNGTATHAGTTSDVGKLTLNGTHTGPISCPGTFGAVFAGAGTNFGFTTLGGLVYPGESNVIGTLTLSGLTLDSGATLLVDLGPTTTVGLGSNDLIQVNGNLTVNGNAITVNPQGLLLKGAGNPYTIIKYTGSLTWNGDLTASGSQNYTFTVNTNTPGEIRLITAGGPPVWDGGSAIGNSWTDSANWGGVAINPMDTLYFAGTTRLNNTNDTGVDTSYTSLVFAPTSGNFVLNGNSIALGSSVANNSTNRQTINLPVNVAAGVTLNGGIGGVTLGGGLTNISGAPLTNTLAGTGTLTNLIGLSAGGAIGLTTTSNASWTVVNNPASTPAAFTGNLAIANGGALTIGAVGSSPQIALQGTAINAVGDGPGLSVLNLINGLVNLDARLNVGNSSTGMVNMSGGTLTTTLLQLADNNTNTVGTINMSGGSFTVSNNVFVSRGTGTFNLSGGTFEATGFYELARALAGQNPRGTINLNGGTFTVSDIRSSSTVAGSVATVNFNGGVLKARQDTVALLNTVGTIPIVARVQVGGAIMDTAGFSVTNPVPLVHDSGLGATPDGGFVKNGAGTLTLTATNTYTGNTTVNAGRLVLKHASLAATSTITVATNSVLELTFAETNKVAGIVLNGASKSPGVYNASTDPTYLAGSGSLEIVSTVNTNPTNITAVVSGGQMTLSWPSSHTGWTLQVQTNTRSVGLNTNWFNVSGSSATNQVTVPVNPANPTVFYRLAYP